MSFSPWFSPNSAYNQNSRIRLYCSDLLLRKARKQVLLGFVFSTLFEVTAISSSRAVFCYLFFQSCQVFRHWFRFQWLSPDTTSKIWNCYSKNSRRDQMFSKFFPPRKQSQHQFCLNMREALNITCHPLLSEVRRPTSCQSCERLSPRAYPSCYSSSTGTSHN